MDPLAVGESLTYSCATSGDVLAGFPDTSSLTVTCLPAEHTESPWFSAAWDLAAADWPACETPTVERKKRSSELMSHILAQSPTKSIFITFLCHIPAKI